MSLWLQVWLRRCLALVTFLSLDLAHIAGVFSGWADDRELVPNHLIRVSVVTRQSYQVEKHVN